VVSGNPPRRRESLVCEHQEREDWAAAFHKRAVGGCDQGVGCLSTPGGEVLSGEICGVSGDDGNDDVGGWLRCKVES
jgi:hypothetical protein